MLDLDLTDDMDVVLEGNRFKESTTNEPTIKTIFYSDERIDNTGGYWFEYESSGFYLASVSRNPLTELDQIADKFFSSVDDLVDLTDSSFTVEGEKVNISLKYKVENVEKEVSFYVN